MVEPSVVSASSRPALVSDTTSYLPDELIAEHDIKLVSLYVALEGEQQAEIRLLANLDGFYERLRVSEEAVTTSQPSVGDFLAVYEPLLDDGVEIVSVHISAGISGTFQTAVQAREQLVSEDRGGERIHLFDSRTAAGGMGVVILAAANAIQAGASAEEAVARAHEARSDLKVWFAVNTLEYLRRGGRIGAAGAWIGTTLKIKPILTFEDEVEPVERVRTRSRAIERLVSYATKAAPTPGSCSTSKTPTPPLRWWSAASRSSGAPRSSPRRWDPWSARTPARACSASDPPPRRRWVLSRAGARRSRERQPRPRIPSSSPDRRRSTDRSCKPPPQLVE